MAPRAIAAPCAPWTTDEDLPESCRDGMTPEILASAHRAATDRLWALSGRRFGASCPVELRPCLAPACGPPGLPAGVWLPCDLPGEMIDLGPDLYEVVSVTVDGVAFEDFEILDHRWLTRTDGHRWPLGPEIVVTVTYGMEVPEGAKAAAIAYICELLEARRPGGRCRLPTRTRTASAQGTTIELDDLASDLADGLTGLSEVDGWILEVNPGRLRSRSRVLNPDVYLRRSRRRTG